MRSMHRILKQPFFGRFQRTWRWPETMLHDDWEHITFPNLRGGALAGVFGAARSGPAVGAVALAHPLSIAAKGFWLKEGHADLLRNAGFDVLAFDFNGFGESESTDFAYPSDVIAAGVYLRWRRPALPIAVVACSFGAGWALCALANEEHPFRAAVLEGVFPTLPFYWRRYPLPYGLLRASQVVYPRLERALRPIRAAAEVTSNPDVLLIYGEADTLTPVSIGIELHAALSTRAVVALWTVPGAEHNGARRAAPEAYAHHVIAFLQASLARARDHADEPAGADQRRVMRAALLPADRSSEANEPHSADPQSAIRKSKGINS